MATITEIKAKAGECDTRSGLGGLFYPRIKVKLRCRAKELGMGIANDLMRTVFMREGDVVTVKIIDEDNKHAGDVHLHEWPLSWSAEDFDIVE